MTDLVLSQAEEKRDRLRLSMFKRRAKTEKGEKKKKCAVRRNILAISSDEESSGGDEEDGVSISEKEGERKHRERKEGQAKRHCTGEETSSKYFPDPEQDNTENENLETSLELLAVDSSIDKNLAGPSPGDNNGIKDGNAAGEKADLEDEEDKVVTENGLESENQENGLECDVSEDSNEDLFEGSDTILFSVSAFTDRLYFYDGAGEKSHYTQTN